MGAGPAGSTAARLLAERGLSVVLLERERLPRPKTCGGGLVGRTLRRLPPGLSFEPQRVCRTAELGFWDEGLSFRTSSEEPLVAMTVRSELDASLVEAAERAGARVRAPCAVEACSPDPRQVGLTTSRGALVARHVVGADGALGRVARAGGWGRLPVAAPALEAELRVPPALLDRFASAARFDFGLPRRGYAWVFPKRDHLSVGVLAVRPGRVRLQEHLRLYLERLGLAGGTLVRHGHPIPLRPRPEGAARGRVLLVGDAAGFVDPLTAEGISFAIRSGELAADALSGDADPARAYSRSAARVLGRELGAARLLAHVVYDRPRLRGLFFRRHGAAMCDAIAAVVAGRRTYRGLLRDPRAWLAVVPGLAAAAWPRGREDQSPVQMDGEEGRASSSGHASR